jgi:hypothetical protein
MTNDCFNHITITSENKNELDVLLRDELQHKKDDKHIYYENIRMIKRGKKGIIFELESRTNPDYDWLNTLLDMYPHCWIKNEWWEEGGNAGVWIGSVKNNQNCIQSMEWEDLCIEAKHFLFLE